MAFTYDLSALSDNPVYQVRFRLGDTDENTASFQDEEIEYALSCNNNNVTLACIDCVEALLPRVAQQTEFSVGPYSEKRGAASYDYWTKLLADLKAKATVYSPPISMAPTGPAIFHYGMLGVDDHAEDA